MESRLSNTITIHFLGVDSNERFSKAVGKYWKSRAKQDPFPIVHVTAQIENLNYQYVSDWGLQVTKYVPSPQTIISYLLMPHVVPDGLLGRISSAKEIYSQQQEIDYIRLDSKWCTDVLYYILFAEQVHRAPPYAMLLDLADRNWGRFILPKNNTVLINKLFRDNG